MIAPFTLVAVSYVLGAWAGHTANSRETARNIEIALDTIGMKQREAAERMGLTLSQLSRQLAGREALNLYRLDALPAEFHLAYQRLQDKRRGGTFVESEIAAYLRAASRLGPKRMLKMLPDLRQQKVQAS